MQKILLALVLIALTSCTSNQLKQLSNASGSQKLLGSFEIDVNTTEKQTFQIEKPEKPSFWGAKHGDSTVWAAALCFDKADTLENMPPFLYASIAFTLKMGEKTFIADTHAGYPRSNDCWWLDERNGVQRRGWAIRAKLLPPEADFNSPMLIEFQILEDKDSELKNLEKIYSKPHLIISTGG